MIFGLGEGKFVIVVPNEGDYLFVMKDLLGRVVDKRHLRGSKVNLNMKLKAGIYFAEIQMKDSRWIIPVVIRDR